MRSKSNLGRRVIDAVTMLLVVALNRTVYAATLRVDASVPVSGNGSSWPLALNDLQQALNAAQSGDQIWVAAGCYVPPVPPAPQDPRTRTFQIPAVGGTGFKIYGGFLGNAHPQGGENFLNERNPEVNITVLDGDPACGEAGGFEAYHVVTASGIPASFPVLNGFHITRGNANGASLGADSGGGLLVSNAGAMIVRSVFLNNRAHSSGGAVRIHAPHVPLQTTFVNTSFFGNRQTNQIADTTSGGSAIVLRSLGQVQLIDCLFSGNVAHVNACLFLGGYPDDFFTQATVTNCTFSGNLVEEPQVAGIDGFGALTLANSILWGNADSLGNMEESTQIGSALFGGVVVTSTCIQGLDVYAGSGNIGADPTFVDPAGPDDTVGTVDDNLRFQQFSACIDTANNADLPALDIGDLDDDLSTSDAFAMDLDLKERIRHETVDMGPYEFFCVGDIDDNNVVNVSDLLALLGAWGPTCPAPPDPCPADINGDGTVDVIDLLALLANWCCNDPGCPPFPASAQGCLDDYWPEIEKVSACIEALAMSGGL